VPPAIAGETIVVSYNDLDGVETVFKASGDVIAAIIVEPIAGKHEPDHAGTGVFWRDCARCVIAMEPC